MAFDFSGKNIFVTGATRGIGRELVVALTKSGAKVYGLGSNKELLDELVLEIPEFIAVQADLTDWDATRSVLEKLPPMSGIVNNAGISLTEQPSLDVSKEIIDKTLSVNLLGAINVIQALGKKMVEAGKGGAIVNVSSIVGVNPMRNVMAYGISKAGLDMATKQFALELGPHNIRVNSVNPTVCLTDMGREHWSDPGKSSKLKDHTPLDRFAEVHEVVNPVLYLLSDYSSMVTGTINPVDGGLLSNINV